jgi:hypothetical protein
LVLSQSHSSINFSPSDITVIRSLSVHSFSLYASGPAAGVEIGNVGTRVRVGVGVTVGVCVGARVLVGEGVSEGDGVFVGLGEAVWGRAVGLSVLVGRASARIVGDE